MEMFTASPERLIIGAALGFAVLLFLIIKAKIQPFIAIMSSALIIGLVVGMPFGMITDTLAEGVGTTLQTIAILIGLGSMFGAILQVSGGVEVIADTLLRVFGEKKAPWALGITGLIVGMPVFFESGLLILIPVAFGIARSLGRSVLYKMFPGKMIEKYLTWTELKGRFLKLFTLAIFLPVAPDDFLCYLAGTTNMTWKQFVTVIFLGKPFSIALYSLGLTTLFQVIFHLL